MLRVKAILAKLVLAEGLVLAGCGCVAALGIDAVLRDRFRYLRWPNANNDPARTF